MAITLLIIFKKEGLCVLPGLYSFFAAMVLLSDIMIDIMAMIDIDINVMVDADIDAGGAGGNNNNNNNNNNGKFVW